MEKGLMESPGVSCWDFAYAAGPCPLSFSAASLTTTPPKEYTVTGNKRNSTARKVQNTPSSPKDPSPSCRPDSPRNFLLSYRHNKQKSSSLKRDCNAAANASTTVLESRTYLLSCPTSKSVTYPHTYTTISTLLSQPRNQIILLVPQSNIVCPRVCELSRLPRSGGSCLQILPIPEVIGMAYNEEAAVFSESGCESDCGGGGDILTDKEMNDINVAEVVRKITKYTKARSFDGYLVFEDDRAKWQFLERVGNGVKEACKKKDKVKSR